eukprot:TRINITY_DN3952_c0_g3_i1.p1 TRINITY_DN3952_c0_g3~~TRINITY_DN3952_c0_g3_i1.p1  ORF type:complete len:547 (+),score=149.47 TRINITY_DN3952_c0_g3_i1:237-1643(+)
MAELPEFNFYEMDPDSESYPYAGTGMDRSIILDEKAPVLKKPETQFSKLENGLKVASIDKGGMTAHIGLYVNAGSRFETAANFGVAHMVSLMAYKSTAHLSNLRTVKTLEQLGSHHHTTCKAGAEETSYQVEVQREFMPFAVPLLIGNVLFPRLLPWEVKSAHADVAKARAAMGADGIVSELLHKAAYCNNTLGHSTLASERSMAYFTPETIRSFMLDHFAPERMVLVGVNVDHAEISKWAMRAFADYNAIPLKKREAVKAGYTGGDLRIEGDSPFCHLAIGLESIPWGQAELAPVALLQTLLGSASSSSASLGGGSSSRLSTSVVRQNPYVESCSAFNTSYSDSGLFGVYGVCAPDQATTMAKGMCDALKSLTQVSKDELAVAKAVLKGKMARQVDDPANLMQDMGQQILLSGTYGGPAEFGKLVDAVTEADVAAAAKKILAARPSLAAYGDTHAVPHYGAIEAMLK